MTRTFVRCLSLFVTLFALLSACGAHAAPPYELRVESAGGERLRTFHHRGQTFALGRMGQRYQIRVVNHTGGRIEAVVTVDGRDVLSGRPGDFRSQRGYLVEGYGEVVIEGFRQSLSEVAAFRFTTPGDSYSSRMGSPENVGIVGLAVFDERARPVPPVVVYEPTDSYEERDHGDDLGGLGSAAESAPSASAPAARGRASAADKASASAAPASEARSERASRIGTQYGESRYSAVSEVPFERASPGAPRFVTTLRYDDRAGLIARGIAVDPPAHPIAVAPRAFPESRFAPAPY
jgi:hypothetical protein